MLRPLSSTRDQALCTEAVRIYRRYASEFVEELNLCPWAERARRTGHVREVVLLQQDCSDCAPAVGAVAALAQDPQVEIGILLFPRLRVDRLPFDTFVSELRQLDAARHELGTIPFAMAAFHPQASPDMSDAERLIPFIRRTPDPTVQLVRRSVLERVRERNPHGTQFMDLRLLTMEALSAPTPPSLRQRIAETNRETVSRLGLPEIERRFRDILEDRAASYARLGEPVGPG